MKKKKKRCEKRHQRWEKVNSLSSSINVITPLLPPLHWGEKPYNICFQPFGCYFFCVRLTNAIFFLLFDSPQGTSQLFLPCSHTRILPALSPKRKVPNNPRKRKLKINHSDEQEEQGKSDLLACISSTIRKGYPNMIISSMRVINHPASAITRYHQINKYWFNEPSAVSP